MDIPLIIWINLDKDYHRNEYMIKSFKKYGLKNKRLSAISGDKYEISYLNDRFKRNQIACSSSHLKAIKYYVDNYSSIGDYCLIAEDDIDISSIELWSKSFWDYLKIFKNVDWNTLQLQTYSVNSILRHFYKKFNISEPYKRVINDYHGTGIYLIKYKRAKHILKELSIIDEQPYIERFINDSDYYNLMNNTKKIHADHNLIYDNKTYILPLFFLQENINSSISQDIDYNDFQQKNNLRIKSFMKQLL